MYLYELKTGLRIALARRLQGFVALQVRGGGRRSRGDRRRVVQGEEELHKVSQVLEAALN